MFPRLTDLGDTPLNQTPETRLDEVLGEYLEAMEAGRAPRREDLLAAHPDLALDLAAFLDDQERFDRLLSPLATPRDSNNLPVLDNSLVGHRVGNYEVLEVVARGGMGVVYKARQHGLNRLVALKVVRAGPGADPQDVQRFRLEAAAVAQLDHPNIVPVYEVGEHDGQPFYTMKLVEGGSLGQAVVSGQWPVVGKDQSRHTAALMVQVARAVHHAHQRGILHRDVKPGNILLSKYEVRSTKYEKNQEDSSSSSFVLRPSSFVAMVADFGLAKPLAGVAHGSGQFRAEPGPATQPGAAVGTPSYMAPEQALGNEVTTAADTYSLGAVLYELLTGQPPFRTPSPLVTLMDVVDRDPEPPRKLNPAVDRDLETICLKCLQKRPQDRYASAANLADDLDRYLRGEPIQARPVGRFERAARWCRRQPLTATLAFTAVAAVVVGFVLVLWQWRRAEDNLNEAQFHRNQAEGNLLEANNQRDRAEKNLIEANSQRDRAEEQRRLEEASFRDAHQLVNDFCVRLSEERLKQFPGMQEVRKELLEAGRNYYLSFLKRKGDRPELKQDLADCYFRLALVTGGTGSPKKALELNEMALTLYRELLAAYPDDLDRKAQIARTLSNMVSQLENSGNVESARAVLREARELWVEVDKKRPGTASLRAGLASLHSNEAGLLRLSGKVPEARVAIEKACELYGEARRLGGKQYTIEHARCWTNLGLYWGDLTQWDKAFEAQQEARKLLEPLADNNAEARRNLAVVYRHLGGLHLRRKEPAEGQALLRRSKEMSEELVRDNPLAAEHRSNLADACSDLGGQMIRQGKTKEGLDLYRLAIELRRKLTDENPGANRLELALAQSYHNLGNYHLNADKPAEALKQYREAVTLFERLVARNPENVSYADYMAGSLNNMADVLQKLKRDDEALTTFEEVVRMARKAHESTPAMPYYRANLGRFLGNLARAYRLAKRPMDAAKASLERRETWMKEPANANEVYRVVRDFLLASQIVPAGGEDQRQYQALALETLEMALNAGFDAEKARADAELTPLRQRPEFEKLIEKYRKNDK